MINDIAGYIGRIHELSKENESLRKENAELKSKLDEAVKALESIKVMAHGTPPFDIDSGDQYIFEKAAETLQKLRPSTTAGEGENP